MKMNKIYLPIALVAVSLAAGCGGKQSPVARVEVGSPEVSLPFGQVRPLRLTWTPSLALEGETPTVFVHLLDSDRKVVRTFDHPFPQRWREGTPVSYDLDLYQSALAPPLPAGSYKLSLGLYGKDGKRWALEGLGEPQARHEYDAATINVPAGDSKPHFTFSANWLPVEPGGDRQVLARRSMANRGAIRLVDQAGPGTVWLKVLIPPANLPDAPMVLDPGATSPSVLVTGSCGPTGGGASVMEANLTGEGVHEAELALEAPPAGGFCRVLLASNFLLEPTEANAKERKRSASLEGIAWSPANP